MQVHMAITPTPTAYNHNHNHNHHPVFEFTTSHNTTCAHLCKHVQSHRR